MAKIATSNPEALARRALFLAYQAAGTAGMGAFHVRDGESEDSVWQACAESRDYPGGKDLAHNRAGSGQLHADYVFGRMLKMSLRWDAEGVEHTDREPQIDYQSWCHIYKTYAALLNAAAESLRLEAVN